MPVAIPSLHLRINLAVQSYFPFHEMENEKNHMYKIFYLKKKYITTLQKKLQHLEINIQKRENRTMHIKSLQKSL